ncbi:hypothetical protein IWZ01DRAFT_211929 [Phyllosticta capitalensis]
MMMNAVRAYRMNRYRYQYQYRSYQYYQSDTYLYSAYSSIPSLHPSQKKTSNNPNQSRISTPRTNPCHPSTYWQQNETIRKPEIQLPVTPCLSFISWLRAMGIGAEGRPFASLPTFLLRSAVGCSLSRWRACVLAYRQQHNRESRMPFAIRVRVWTNDVPCLMHQRTLFPPSCPSAPKAFWGFLCVLFPLFAPHSSQTDGPGRMRRTDTPRHDTPSPPATATQWAHRPTTDEKDDDDNALCHLESKGAAQYSPAQPNPPKEKPSSGKKEQ